MLWEFLFNEEFPPTEFLICERYDWKWWKKDVEGRKWKWLERDSWRLKELEEFEEFEDWYVLICSRISFKSLSDPRGETFPKIKYSAANPPKQIEIHPWECKLLLLLLLLLYWEEELEWEIEIKYLHSDNIILN